MLNSFYLQEDGVFFLLGSVVAYLLSFPKKVFRCQLKDRDVTIEIRIENAFEISGDLVVPTNTTFDTDLDGKIPKAHSIQGEFTRRYYDSEVNHLDLDINKELSKEDCRFVEQTERKRGKKKQYPIGTVIQLKRKERIFYLIANTHINDAGVAKTSIEKPKRIISKTLVLYQRKRRKRRHCDSSFGYRKS